jgi:uncharacterized phage protein (TIGR01671 family)
MREILFRAKAINRDSGYHRTKYKNGDWVYGLIARPYNDMFPTLPMEFRNENGVSGIDVDYKTVGQFTGVTDKNGKKIFEGDIVATRYQSGGICSIGDVQFDSGVFGAEWTSVKENKGMVGSWGQLHNLRRFDDCIIKNIEVIGNIHDNPELEKELQNG